MLKAHRAPRRGFQYCSGDASDPFTQKHVCCPSDARHLHFNELRGTLPREWSALENLEEM